MIDKKSIILMLSIFLSGFAFATERPDCTMGRPDPTTCVAQLKVAEKKLSDYQQKFYKKISQKEKFPSESSSAEIIGAVKLADETWKKFRDAECESVFLTDGTGAGYVQALAQSCKLGMTLKRAAVMKNKIKNLE